MSHSQGSAGSSIYWRSKYREEKVEKEKLQEEIREIEKNADCWEWRFKRVKNELLTDGYDSLHISYLKEVFKRVENTFAADSSSGDEQGSREQEELLRRIDKLERICDVAREDMSDAQSKIQGLTSAIATIKNRVDTHTYSIENLEVRERKRKEI